MKILIATPAYAGQVCADYTESLLYTCMMLSSLKIEYQVKFIKHQIVTRARNMLSSIFLDDESFTHMLFIDADIVWHPLEVKKLIDHDLECVIGVYPNKRYFWEGDKLILKPSSAFDKLNSKLDNEEEESVNMLDNNLIKIKYAATGFMLLKRAALERIKDDVDSFFLPGGNGEPILLHNYWDCKVVDHDYLTEDFHFSYLFNKNGGKIYADKSINLKHIGPHIYGELLKE